MIPGEWIQLRAIEPADLPFLRDLSNHREVAARVVGWSFPLSDHGQARWFEGAHDAANTRRFMVVDPDGERLGMTGLWDIDWRNRHALTAMKLHPDRPERRGVGTDAILTLFAYAFHDVGLNRLWSTILPFNGPSLGAYVKKCGMRIEGVQREEVFRKGRFHDLYRVAILRREFDALEAAREYVERIVPADTEQRVQVPDSWWARGEQTEPTIP